MGAISVRLRQPINWRGLIADITLVALLAGPLAAPLLQGWGALAPRAVSSIIYTMGTFVCPQPAQGLALHQGQIMAVCMRCYGTLLGLLLTRLLYTVDGGIGSFWLHRRGLCGLPIFTALIFSYPAEYAGQVVGLWSFHNSAATIAGVLAGAGLGLMFHPLLQASYRPRTSPTRASVTPPGASTARR